MGICFLVGGFNPVEKYLSNWIIYPGRDKNKQYLKPPPSFSIVTQLRVPSDLLLQLAQQHPVLSTSVIILAFQPAKGSFLTR